MATTPKDFPLPEVAEALSPFIRTRQEVSAIRQNLHAHLESQLDHHNTPLTTATLRDALPKHPDQEPPQGLSGVRKAYYRALQAHAAAQERYAGLKADLDRLSVAGSGPGRANDVRSGEAVETESYVQVLRQRQRLRKLRAIERAVDDATGKGEALLARGVEGSVSAEVGQAPVLPVARVGESHVADGVEEKVMELKKAILVTKHSVDAIETRSGAENGVAGSTGEEHALQRAHDELSAWIERQLSIIAETEPSADDYDDHSEETQHTPNKNNRDIEALYTTYLASRTSLLSTLTNPPPSPVPPPEPAPQLSSTKATVPVSNPAATLLPYLPALLHSRETQQGHLNATSHLRRTLALSDEDTRRLFARLADESHMVPPGAQGGEEWVQAGMESSGELERFVRGRLEVGGKGVGEGERGLVEAQALVDGLRKACSDRRA